MPLSTTAASCCLRRLRCSVAYDRSHRVATDRLQRKEFTSRQHFPSLATSFQTNLGTIRHRDSILPEQKKKSFHKRSLFDTSFRVRMSAESKDSGASTAPPAKADIRSAGDAAEQPNGSPIVQYLVIRKDLVDIEKWPLGALLAQASHAAVAAVWLNREDPATIEYCSRTNLDNMHKVGGFQARFPTTISLSAFSSK